MADIAAFGLEQRSGFVDGDRLRCIAYFQRDIDTDYGRDRSLLNRMLYRETRHTNVPAVLMYSDRNAMAHSVEARFPYLDHRIVELCFSLPAAYKVGFGLRKLLLFETALELFRLWQFGVA